MGKVVDIAGKKFGMLTAVETAKEDGKTKWLFKCDCGNDYIQTASRVKSGDTKSCGCAKYKTDCVGQKHGKLLIQKELPNAEVKCLCDCGQETIKKRYKVLNGHIKSCGCTARLPVDYTGMKFGYLYIKEEAEKSKSGAKRFLCICECGKEVIVQAGNLQSGCSKSCGCMKGQLVTKGKTKDLAGQVFSRLTVNNLVGYNKHAGAVWNCACECGATTNVVAAYLISGKTRSCGCLGRELTAKIFTKENPAKEHPLYHTWTAMKGRCHNKKNRAYNSYGGRGIKVCSRWKNGEDGLTGFQCFVLDMGDKPNKEYSLDRVDNSGDYSPENCKWATPQEQRANQRPQISNHQYDEVVKEREEYKSQLESVQDQIDVLKLQIEQLKDQLIT